MILGWAASLEARDVHRVPYTCTMQRDASKEISFAEVLDMLPWGKFHWQLFATCGLGYTADVTELLLLSFVFPEIGREWRLDNQTLAAASLLSNIGIMCGAASWGMVSDWFGRRMAFLGSVSLTFVCGMASAFSPSFLFFVLARFCVGFGLGGNLAVDFVMFLEFVPTRARKCAMMLLTMWGVLGVVIIALVAWALIPTLGWRWYVAALSLPSLALLLLRLEIPESPAYLYASGRRSEAFDVIDIIARRNGTPLPLEFSRGSVAALAKLDSMSLQDVDYRAKATPGKLLRLFLEAPLARGLRCVTARLGAIWLLMSFANGGFTLWLPQLLRSKSIHGTDVYRDYAVMAASEVPGLLIATALVHAGVEKRMVLAGAATGCAATTLLCSTASTSRGLVTAMAGNYFFVVSAWACLYVVTPESYPTHCRSSATGFARVWSCTGGLIAGPVGAWLLGISDWAPLVAYALCFALIALLALSLPATPPDCTDSMPREEDLLPACTDSMPTDEELAHVVIGHTAAA